MKWLNKTQAAKYMNGEIQMMSEQVKKDLTKFSKLVSEKIDGLPLFEKPSDFVYHIQKLYMKEIGYGNIFVNTDSYPRVEVEVTIFDKEVNSNITAKLDISTGYFTKAPDETIHYYKDSSFSRKLSNDDFFDKIKKLNAFIEKEIVEAWIRILNTKKISGKINYGRYRNELELNAFDDKGNYNDLFKVEMMEIRESESNKESAENLKNNITILQNSKRLLKALMTKEEPILSNGQLSKFFDSLEFVDSYRESETIEWDVYSF